MIREATGADIPRIVEMGARFHAAGGIKAGYDQDAVSRLLAELIEADAGCLLVSDSGMIGGALVPAYCDPSWMMAVEMFWWADRDGLQLLHRFEEWAAENGAQEVRMTSLASLPRADAILRRKGYAPTEISYQKVI